MRANPCWTSTNESGEHCLGDFTDVHQGPGYREAVKTSNQESPEENHPVVLTHSQHNPAEGGIEILHMCDVKKCDVM